MDPLLIMSGIMLLVVFLQHLRVNDLTKRVEELEDAQDLPR